MKKSLKATASPQALTAWQSLPPDELQNQMNAIGASRRAEITAESERRFDALIGVFPSLVQDGLRMLRQDCLRAKGFMRKNFNIFAGEDPVAAALQDLESFETYFRKNGLSFDSEELKLTAGKKPKTKWEHFKDWRFFWAAAGGITAGAIGVDLQQYPGFSESIGLFFGYGLQVGAPLFIGLNVFKAFTEHDLFKALPTLGRFLAITTAGFAVGYLVNLGLSQVIPMVDPSKLIEYVPEAASSSFSLMPYLPYIIGGLMGAACLYKSARDSLSAKFTPAAEEGGIVSRLWRGSASLARKATVYTGRGGVRAAESLNEAFPTFINYAGIPAIMALLSSTISQGGVEQLKEYMGFYATAGSGILIGTALMLGAYWAMGCRTRESFRDIMQVYKDAVSISSSSMVLKQEAECAQKLGVRKSTTDRVIPLAGVFNMYGLSLYLGQVTFYALNMFGHNPTPMEYMAAAATILYISMGAPGVPAATIAFLDPVMRQMGFSNTEIYKTFAMIMPGDRFADMGITGANALGDMAGAVWEDHHLVREKQEAVKLAAAAATDTLPPPAEPDIQEARATGVALSSLPHSDHDPS